MVEPAAPGLDLICRGIRLVSTDDHVALERGTLIYDALYAELGADPPGFGDDDFANLGEARLALDLWPLLFRKRLHNTLANPPYTI